MYINVSSTRMFHVIYKKYTWVKIDRILGGFDKPKKMIFLARRKWIVCQYISGPTIPFYISRSIHTLGAAGFHFSQKIKRFVQFFLYHWRFEVQHRLINHIHKNTNSFCTCLFSQLSMTSIHHFIFYLKNFIFYHLKILSYKTTNY